MRTNYNLNCLITSGLLTLTGLMADAAVVFNEDFNSYSGTTSTLQYETDGSVAYQGSVTGWSQSGIGAIHAVDLNNSFGQSTPSNWAIMIYNNNVITQSTGIAANGADDEYSVALDYGTGVYTHDYQRTLAGDGLLVEVLREDDSVLASQTFFPGAWDDVGNRNFDAGLHGTFTYTGDGSGSVRLRIGAAGSIVDRFEGSIDNLSITTIPEPTSAAILGAATLAMGLRRRRLFPA